MEEKSEARTSSEGEILTLAAVLALGIGAGVARCAVYEASFGQNGKTKAVRGTTQDGEVTFEGIPLGRISVREVTSHGLPS